MHTATLKPKLNYGSQMVSEEMFTANLMGSWSELSLRDYWKRYSKKEQKESEDSSTQNSMRKESKERYLLSGMKKIAPQNKETKL